MLHVFFVFADVGVLMRLSISSLLILFTCETVTFIRFLCFDITYFKPYLLREFTHAPRSQHTAGAGPSQGGTRRRCQNTPPAPGEVGVGVSIIMFGLWGLATLFGTLKKQNCCSHPRGS